MYKNCTNTWQPHISNKKQITVCVRTLSSNYCVNPNFYE